MIPKFVEYKSEVELRSMTYYLKSTEIGIIYFSKKFHIIIVFYLIRDYLWIKFEYLLIFKKAI